VVHVDLQRRQLDFQVTEGMAAPRPRRR
jgi:hypothetical protein